MRLLPLFALYAVAQDDEALDDENLDVTPEDMEDGPTPPPPEELTMEQLLQQLSEHVDHDKDGSITKADFMRHIEDKERADMLKNAEHELKLWDNDKSGGLTLFEIQQLTGISEEQEEEMQILTESFEAADDDHNGSLDVKELGHFLMPAFAPKVAAVEAKRAFKDFDANGDGKLLMSEFHPDEAEGAEEGAEEAEKMFATLDKNKDGVVDLQEFEALHSFRTEVERVVEAFMENADKDKDGKVTIEDAKANFDVWKEQDLVNYWFQPKGHEDEL
mmetsp:Transcript_58538/g.128350  ORF Transcript_58538/g.128350 Transcript_58538/m.128350 type:complete len:275 (-) Transcript_58538:181-1005(-)